MSERKNIRILIADDDDVSTEQARCIVEEMGFHVVGTAINGKEAVEMTASLLPDIVLMDIKMSPVDGFEATRRIQQQCPTPVILLTAYQTHELVEEANASGVEAYLIKPVSIGELERTLLIAKARFDDMMRLHLLNDRLQTEILERKRVEEELKSYRDRLEELVETRTAELREINDHLHQEVVIRKQAEEQGKILLREKTLLLQEIEHRARNNMQVMNSILELQRMHVEDEKIVTLLKTLQGRIRAMALVHEKLYRSDLTTVDLQEVLLDLVQTLRVYERANSDGFTFSFDVESVRLAIDPAVSFGLMGYEILSNAMRHAFPNNRSGNVSIHLHPGESGTIEFIVRDDGIGLPEHFTLDKLRTLGLKLVQIIVEHQLQGTVAFHNRAPGTEVVVRFIPPCYKSRIEDA
jgi:two-component sensor histidine kinase/AmiR/NasT family two-component response regulator